MTIADDAVAARIVIAISIAIVWVGRFDNIVREFKQYGLPDVVRHVVGATTISLATLLVAGIWYPALVAGPALIMAFLMLCAPGRTRAGEEPVAQFPAVPGPAAAVAVRRRSAPGRVWPATLLSLL